MDKMREEFEKWIKKGTGFDLCRTNFAMTDYCDQQYMDHSTNLAWLSWQAANKAAVPDGYCVVPVEPTDEMIKKAPKP